MVSTSKKLWIKEYYLDRKDFSSFCFCWWKPLLKLERIKFLKNNLIFLLMEIIGGIQFLKVTLFWQMETDFRAFFLLVETIIEIWRNSVFKKYFC